MKEENNFNVLVVDDALTSRRVYNPAFPPEKAVAIMREERGTRFDPVEFDAFLDAEHPASLPAPKSQFTPKTQTQS